MSEEIIRRILTNKKKVLFEFTEVEDDSNLSIEESEDTVEEIIPQEDSLVHGGTSSESSDKVCECGSTNIIVENGEEICDDCGRRYVSIGELSEPLLPKKIEESEKYTRKEVLVAALRYWNAGKYEKAMNVCKKYGVSEKDFIKLLVHSYRESDEVEGNDIEESSIIKPEEDKVGGNIIRAIQKPVSTKCKPEVSDVIS